MSYRGAADYILSEALATTNEEERRKLALALQAMLFIKNLAPDSAQIINKGLNILENIPLEKCELIRKHSIDSDLDPASLRSAIVDYIKSNGETLPQPIAAVAARPAA